MGRLQSVIFDDAWPVIYTTSMYDYSQADAYANETSFVWFINKHVKLDPDFKLSWRPSSDDRTKVHTFSQCNNATECKPVRWDVCKLVPTNHRDKNSADVKQPMIAAFTKNIFQTFVYSVSPVGIDKKFEKFKQRVPEARLITKTSCNLHTAARIAAQRAMSSYIWLVDLDIELPDDFEFDYQPEGGKMYTWNAMVNGKSVVTDAVRLIDRRSLRMPLHEIEKTHTNLDAGTLNVTSDPYSTWVRFFVETIRALSTDSELPSTDNIVKLHRFASRGIKNGTEFYNNFKDDPTYVFDVVSSPATINEYHEYFKKSK